MRSVAILAGIPGSGKTTFRKSNFSAWTVCSLDSYFEHGSKWKFDPAELGAAHGRCLRACVTWLRPEEIRPEEEVIRLVIDNTNTTIAEISPYIALCNAYDAETTIYVLMCDPMVAASRNIHGVPEFLVYQMDLRLKRMLSEWPTFWPRPMLVGS